MQESFNLPKVKRNIDSVNDSLEQKLWTTETTKLLISLVKEHDSEFQKSIKKHVWQKIGAKINAQCNLNYSWLQCDTKWKGLLKTYKDVRDHNSDTGRNKRTWQFFDAMNELLFTKPEITAEATCSSSSGLKRKGVAQKR